ncbi:hypothetical protein OG458_28635 [Streptomyces sp. NBC_01281]|uniref:hypothetical protein n=1 Tax=unclassified Streptomyces TaxID=2593676 RepID=UPI00224E4966|nr:MULTISPECIES: hypothetical protein [unclassified Streptomyces]MCX5133432.1 hypothetical protein [Streptomyces sp. NBC_00340]WSK63523.1 hypothetical protein OG458_28635 [Streptomyces sp. NBC_01281]
MKPEQDPERNPSGDATMKGRVTPVPPERPEDDRAKPADSASDEDVSRREALKGHLDPTADEQTPGDRARAGDTAAVRSATTSDDTKSRTGTTGTSTGIGDEAKSRTGTGGTTGTSTGIGDEAKSRTGTTGTSTGIGDEAKAARAARTGDDTAARTTGTGTPARDAADVRGGTGRSVTSRDTDLDADDGKPGSASRDAGGVRRDAPGTLPTSGSADSGTRTDGKAHGQGSAKDSAKDSAKHGERLLPGDEYDKFSERMRHAVGGFVDGPEASVEEADHVLEELASRFTEAVSQRRRSLRSSWQSGGEGKASASDTEKLRLALQDYREMTERLLHI